MNTKPRTIPFGIVASSFSDNLSQNSCIHHFHIDHNAPCLPPKILHNNCFQSLLGITVVPGEIQDNGYANFGGQTSCIVVYVKIVNTDERTPQPLKGLRSGSN